MDKNAIKRERGQIKKIVTEVFIRGICIPDLVQIGFIGTEKIDAKKCHHHHRHHYHPSLPKTLGIFGNF